MLIEEGERLLERLSQAKGREWQRQFRVRGILSIFRLLTRTTCWARERLVPEALIRKLRVGYLSQTFSRMSGTVRQPAYRDT